MDQQQSLLTKGKDNVKRKYNFPKPIPTKEELYEKCIEVDGGWMDDKKQEATGTSSSALRSVKSTQEQDESEEDTPSKVADEIEDENVKRYKKQQEISELKIKHACLESGITELEKYNKLVREKDKLR